jgi:hypothetical protein
MITPYIILVYRHRNSSKLCCFPIPPQISHKSCHIIDIVTTPVIIPGNMEFPPFSYTNLNITTEFLKTIIFRTFTKYYNLQNTPTYKPHRKCSHNPNAIHKHKHDKWTDTLEFRILFLLHLYIFLYHFVPTFLKQKKSCNGQNCRIS